MGEVLLWALVILLVAFCLRNIIRDIKSGSCGGCSSGSGCSGNCSCCSHRTDADLEKKADPM